MHRDGTAPSSGGTLPRSVQRISGARTRQRVYPLLHRLAVGDRGVALGHKARQAADAVAAHLRLAAVAVEDAHAVVRVALGRQREYHLQAERRSGIIRVPPTV